MKCQALNKDLNRVWLDVTPTTAGIKLTNPATGETFYLIREQLESALAAPPPGKEHNDNGLL